MLYERWNEVAHEHGHEMALREIASGQTWTFAQLAAEGEKGLAQSHDNVFPCGHSAEFIFSVLRAWRENKIVCPLEPGQPPPEITSVPKKCAHVKLTSGTTAAPRLVLFTGEQLAADAAQIVSAMGLRHDIPNLAVISLAHSYGFSNLVLPLLLHGIPLLIAQAPLPEIVRRAAVGEKALALPAVPAMWRAWHEAGGIPSQVRVAISAGAPLPIVLEQSIFKTSGIKVHNFYGSSECGGIGYDASANPRTDASLAGTPMPNVILSLNDEGCLVVDGPTVAEGYLPKNESILGNKKFVSNDLAELKDGAVYLRGRANDQINVAGRKVLPEAIEQALLGHGKVNECLVFGKPSGDSSRGETIVAVIATSAPEDELKNFLLERLPAWQVPRVWKFVKALPVGRRGKISRTECRSLFDG